MPKLIKYHCHWGSPVTEFSRTAVADSFAELKDGFWVDDNYDYVKPTGHCNAKDSPSSLYWIPPSCLRYIKKVEVDHG
jgi:hypothetical protein